ncbi:MAG: histidine kinase dimerization/phospho-acceptor domain-containing protein, partial [Leptolyngbyaceae bacterium]|nr:histidine kinase dimerization/phospho-acceptor domain-containing protein [Leptolyngbyaceae bacterium]
SICILSFTDQDRQYFKSAVGLSRIGLMNDLAVSRQLPRDRSFCDTIIRTQRSLIIEDAGNHPDYKDSLLVQRYGIQAYLGVPLFNSEGYCLGTLAVMELAPRQFTDKDTRFLELTARWSMSEVERNQLLDAPVNVRQTTHVSSATAILATTTPSQAGPWSPAVANTTGEVTLYANTVKGNLIAQMVQDLRTPLTSILGMASVLTREIYGTLSQKQKEYIDIIHSSSQSMLSLVDETIELGGLDAFGQTLDLGEVDVEMFCQQCLAKLRAVCKQREQDISLTIEPGQRTWVLDKVKVKQMLYHLVFRVIHISNPGSLIRIHISRKASKLNLAIWSSHPFLEEGLPHTELHYASGLSERSPHHWIPALSATSRKEQQAIAVQTQPVPSPATPTHEPLDQEQQALQTRQHLGILLCQVLVQIHRGTLTIQGSLESGYRYVLTLPYLEK